MTWLSRAIAIVAFGGILLVALARLAIWIRWRVRSCRPRARVCFRCGVTVETGTLPAVRVLCPTCIP